MVMNKLLVLIGVLAIGIGAHTGVASDRPSQKTSSLKKAYAKGADVGWLSQLEAQGHKFYTPDAERKEMECMQLLRDYCGVNSIRLRVWVNPKNGWNSIPDVMAKAKRASDLGLRTMIDFHFSDHWADPGQQEMPEAWKSLSFEDQKKALANHVTETLTALKNIGVTPEWVQIGNETTPGMMLPVGSLDNPEQLTALNNAGYDAVKAVLPNAKVIGHLDNGHDRERFDRMFGMFEKHGGKYDMIGMSIYPYWAAQNGYKGGWKGVADDAIANIEYLKERYGRPVMICEVGMPYDQGELCAEFIRHLMTADSEGIFYWEPEAPEGYNGGYNLGCFQNGAPNAALTPFREK